MCTAVINNHTCMPKLTKSSSILVVGAGAWGTSTALALGRAGYTSVVVIDPYPVPSPLSAATDISKLVDGAVTSPDADAKLRAMATAAHRWLTDPIYAPFHRPTGYIVAGSTPKAIEMLYEDDLPNMPNTVMYNSAQDFRKALSEEMFTGEFPGWKGFLDNNPGAGWVDSVRAVGAAAMESERLGVNYQVGKVNKLLYDSISQDVVGAVLEGGTEIRADYTILCAGAYSSQIVELHDEIHAVAWVVAHIKLSDTELEAFKGMPVLWSNNLGFMTPPDARTKELKICDQHSGYVSRVIQDGRLQSVPFARDDIPVAAEARIRRLLRETVPKLADRNFSHARICWDADTADGNFVIDRHPTHPSLIVAVGGSGLGVMTMPMIGEWIMAELEDRLDTDLAEMWKIRPESGKGRDWRDCPHAWANPLDKREEIADEKEWTSIGTPFAGK